MTDEKHSNPADDTEEIKSQAMTPVDAPGVDLPAPAGKGEEKEEPALTDANEVSTATMEGEARPISAALELPREFRPRWWARLVPGAHRRDRQMAGLRSGHQEVLSLVQAVRDNLEAQVYAQHKLVDSLAHLPAAVDGLKGIGDMSRQQKEMLEVIKGQLDSNMSHNRGISHSLERFSDTLNAMDSTTQHLADRARNSEETLREMLRRSERRMMFMSTILVLLLLGIGSFCVYAAWRNGWVEIPALGPAPTATSVASPEKASASGGVPPVATSPSAESKKEAPPVSAPAKPEVPKPGPTPSKPLVIKPEDVKPAPPKPTVPAPLPTQPTPEKPAPIKPEPVKPAAAKVEPGKPVPAKPAVTNTEKSMPAPADKPDRKVPESPMPATPQGAPTPPPSPVKPAPPPSSAVPPVALPVKPEVKTVLSAPPVVPAPVKTPEVKKPEAVKPPAPAPVVQPKPAPTPAPVQPPVEEKEIPPRKDKSAPPAPGGKTAKEEVKNVEAPPSKTDDRIREIQERIRKAREKVSQDPGKDTAVGNQSK